MAITSMLTVSYETICLNPEEGICVMGVLGENAMPGQVVVKFDSTGVWMLADSDDTNNAMGQQRVGIVGYDKRINPSTMALKTITAVYTYNSAGDKQVPIWISGICYAFCIDLNETWPAGGDLTISSTAGSFQQSKLEQGTHTETGTSLQKRVAASAAARIADGDTICIAALGRNYGEIWAGHNTA
jgi:hypothetical protein